MRHTFGLCLSLLYIALGGAWPQTANARDNSRWMQECAKWIAQKGYSVDYIEQRTGQRPSGNMAQNWRSNLDPKDVRVNDVVFVGLPDGTSERVEVVDEVQRDEAGKIKALRTSSMNWGAAVEPRCHVTENFGKVVTRTIPADHIRRAWRAQP